MLTDPFEVIWNGAMDPPFVRQFQRPAPPLEPTWATAAEDTSNDHVPARFLAHLATAEEHTSRSVMAAMGVSPTKAGEWLYRARRLGLIAVVRTQPAPGGGLVRVYARPKPDRDA